MFAMLGYTGVAGVNASNFDLTAAADNDFSQRNGHYIFTENYNILGLYAFGTSMISARTQAPTWNAIGESRLAFTNRSTNPSANTLTDFRGYFPMAVPLNEEVQFQVSNNLGAATEQETGFIWVGTADWKQTLPKGLLNIVVNVTATITTVANAWSGPNVVTFAQSLRGGVYSVVGCNGLSATSVDAFRIIFPRQTLYNGRKLRPGDICATGGLTLTNAPQYGDPQARIFGEWGRFHTFEPPQFEVWATTAAAQNCVFNMSLVYLGTDLSLLQMPGVSTI